MRRLFWQVSTTLDGFMADERGGLERTAGVLDDDFERYASAMLAAWNNAELARDGVAAVRRWKQEDGGDLALFGSSQLAASLLAEGLVDELRLLVTPFVLGGGTRTFAAADMARGLQLVRAVTWRSATVFATYRPA